MYQRVRHMASLGMQHNCMHAWQELVEHEGSRDIEVCPGTQDANS